MLCYIGIPFHQVVYRVLFWWFNRFNHPIHGGDIEKIQSSMPPVATPKDQTRTNTSHQSFSLGSNCPVIQLIQMAFNWLLDLYWMDLPQNIPWHLTTPPQFTDSMDWFSPWNDARLPLGDEERQKKTFFCPCILVGWQGFSEWWIVTTYIYIYIHTYVRMYFTN